MRKGALKQGTFFVDPRTQLITDLCPAAPGGGSPYIIPHRVSFVNPFSTRDRGRFCADGSLLPCGAAPSARAFVNFV